MGLDPRTPGSHPGPKAGTKPLSYLGIPGPLFLYHFFSLLLLTPTHNHPSTCQVTYPFVHPLDCETYCHSHATSAVVYLLCALQPHTRL